MMEDAIDKEAVTRLDILISQKITALWTPWLNKTMIIIGDIFGTNIFLILGVVVCLVLIYKRRRRNCLLTIFSLSGGYALESLLKQIIQRARPENALVGHAKFSFPSGHATMSIIFFCLLIYLFRDGIKNKIAKHFFIAVNILLFLLVGFSRIYMNVHWFSDVIAGFALGLFWLTLLILIFEYFMFLNTKMFKFFSSA